MNLTSEQIIIRLLFKIDIYFETKFTLTQNYDYEYILKTMIEYYCEIRN